MTTDHDETSIEATELPASPSLPVTSHPAPSSPGPDHQERRIESARAFWAAVVVAIVVLVLLIVFILDNLADVKVSYLGAVWHPPLGIALLLASVVGGIVVVLAVAARILQIRRKAHRASSAPR